MDQPSRAEKAQNKADTSDLDMFSDPSSSSPQHRPGHSRAHGHHKSRHHPHVPHHHSGSQHGEFQDIPDRALSRHSTGHRHRHPPHHGGARHSTSFVASGSRDTVLSHHSSAEDLFGDEHRQSSRRLNSRPHHHSESYSPGGPHSHSGSNTSGMPRHHSGLHHHSDISHYTGLPPEGEPYYQEESNLDNEAYDQGGAQHRDADDHSRRRRHQAHHHRRPLHHGETHSHPAYGGSSHQAVPPHYSSEHRHGHRSHHSEHRHRERRHDAPHSEQYEEYHHAGSPSFGPRRSRSAARVGPAQSSLAALPPSRARSRSLTGARPAAHPHAPKGSNKVHPQDSFSKTSGSWAEDEQLQKRKTGRVQRVHKKLHNWLWEKVSHLFHGLRKMLRSLTDSLVFDAFIFLVVCLNTIMLVAQTFAEVEIRGEWYFMAFDSVFLSIYVLEAMLKIMAMGLDYFYDFWNNLDFVIMVMAVLDFSLMQFNSRSFKRTIYNQSVFRIFKVFKSLRALRAVRVLRRLSFLTSLQEVTGTLARSLPSIAAILVLMFTCLFLFSVVLRALFRQSDPKRFQNILTTIFTLFTLLTLDDWSQIYVDSQTHGAWHIIPILMIYIIIQYFIFLNLVIAVLVDNFQMALLRGLEKVKQERAAKIHEPLLYESLTELSKAGPEEVMSEHAKQKHLFEKKFGTMTEKQQELLSHFLQLVAGVEHHQQKFRSQAAVIDEIVDTAFEAGEEDFRK